MSSTCIYPGPHSPNLSKEHYLPEALGNFEGMELLQGRVCKACNEAIGRRVETQFLRTGPIGFSRWLVGVRGRNGLPPSPFYQGAGGADPIYIVGKVPDWPFDVLWELEPGTENVCPLQQIVFHHPILGHRPVPILKRFREQPETFIDHLRSEGLETARPVHVFSARDEIPLLEQLLKRLGHEAPREWTDVGASHQRIDLVITYTVTEAYFRAIAKIAFHYLLKMFPEFTGHEREFDGIKDFIWKGGPQARYVVQRRDQFIANLNRGYRPTN